MQGKAVYACAKQARPRRTQMNTTFGINFSSGTNSQISYSVCMYGNLNIGIRIDTVIALNEQTDFIIDMVKTMTNWMTVVIGEDLPDDYAQEMDRVFETILPFYKKGAIKVVGEATISNAFGKVKYTRDYIKGVYHISLQDLVDMINAVFPGANLTPAKIIRNILDGEFTSLMENVMQEHLASQIDENAQQ